MESSWGSAGLCTRGGENTHLPSLFGPGHGWAGRCRFGLCVGVCLSMCWCACPCVYVCLFVLVCVCVCLSERIDDRAWECVCLMLRIRRCVCGCVCVRVFDILLINPLSPHKDLGLMVQGEGPIIFPEAVKQFQVFEFPVLVTY